MNPLYPDAILQKRRNQNPLSLWERVRVRAFLTLFLRLAN